MPWRSASPAGTASRGDGRKPALAIAHGPLNAAEGHHDNEEDEETGGPRHHQAPAAPKGGSGRHQDGLVGSTVSGLLSWLVSSNWRAHDVASSGPSRRTTARVSSGCSATPGSVPVADQCEARPLARLASSLSVSYSLFGCPPVDSLGELSLRRRMAWPRLLLARNP